MSRGRPVSLRRPDGNDPTMAATCRARGRYARDGQCGRVRVHRAGYPDPARAVAAAEQLPHALAHPDEVAEPGPEPDEVHEPGPEPDEGPEPVDVPKWVAEHLPEPVRPAGRAERQRVHLGPAQGGAGRRPAG